MYKHWGKKKHIMIITGLFLGGGIVSNFTCLPYNFCQWKELINGQSKKEREIFIGAKLRTIAQEAAGYSEKLL